MAIHYYYENIKKPKLRYRLISNWLKYILTQNSLSLGSISIVFCNDESLLKMNQKYLKHDYYTDIITFDYVTKNVISGDIFISTERVKDNSIKFGVNLEEEFLRVISHGILHLLGYGDQLQNEKVAIRKLESEYISFYKSLENDSSYKI